MTDQSPSSTTRADPAKYRRLIETAAGEFARVGFERANIDRIAVGAGVGKGTVYLYFANKAALFLAVLDDVRARLSAALAGADGDDPIDALRRSIRTHLHLGDDAPELFRCYTSALFGVNRDFQAAALAIFTWQQDELQSLVDRAAPLDDLGQAGARAALLAGSILSAGLVRGLRGQAGSDAGLEERLLLHGFLSPQR